MSKIVLRGYAAPFNQQAFVADSGGGFNERILPRAFSGMLRDGRPVALQFDTHDPAPALARSQDGTLTLFEDDYGLGFEASLPDTQGNWSICRSVIRTHGYCSVNFAKCSARRLAQKGSWGTATDEIDWAEIDHITIAERAVYKGTSIWPAHCDLDRAPHRIQDAADRWAQGFMEANRRIAAARRVEELVARSKANAKHRPPEQDTQFLSSVLAHAMAGGANMIIGHAAFSRRSFRKTGFKW